MQCLVRIVVPAREMKKKIPKTNQQKLNEKIRGISKQLDASQNRSKLTKVILWSAKCKRNLAKCVERKKKQKLHAVHLVCNHISKMIFPSTVGIVVGFHFIFLIILWCICDNTVCRCRAPYTSIKCERNFEKTGSSLKSFVVHFMHNAQHRDTHNNRMMNVHFISMCHTAPLQRLPTCNDYHYFTLVNAFFYLHRFYYNRLTCDSFLFFHLLISLVGCCCTFQRLFLLVYFH